MTIKSETESIRTFSSQILEYAYLVTSSMCMHTLWCVCI